MTAGRRLAAVEASLSPTERVVRWLAEARVLGDLETYAKASFAEGPEGLPLDRLAREAAEAERSPNASIRAALRPASALRIQVGRRSRTGDRVERKRVLSAKTVSSPPAYDE